MGRLTIFVVAVVAGSLGAITATNFFDETAGTPANAESGSQPASAGTGPPVWGDLNCDGRIDGVDALADLRSIASVEPAPQLQPCTAIGSPFGDQADSARFEIFPDTAYCGAQSNGPYTLNVAVSNPPALTNPDDPESAPKPGHDGAGWLDVEFQQQLPDDRRGAQYNVPTNSSFSFTLTPGGVPGVDQLVRISSPPKGDESGGGAQFIGFASVHASGDAHDPFDGDDTDNNFCVAIGFPDAAPGEFAEGEISTTLPVLDGWVLDGDGSDGGVLRAAPH